MTDKKQLRKELVTKRKKMTDEEFSKKSLRICNRLLNNSQYLKSKDSFMAEICRGLLISLNILKN